MAGQRQDGVPIAEAAARLGLSPEAVRKRLNRGTLPGYKLEGTWYVTLDRPGPVSGRPDGGRTEWQDVSGQRQDAAPIEADYQVTPDELQRAIERTGTKYVADFAQLYERVNEGLARLYEARLAEKDATIAAKDHALAADALAIAELRRRAEVAEAEVSRRRDEEEQRQEEAAVPTSPLLTLPEAPGAQEAPAREPWWPRLARVFVVKR